MRRTITILVLTAVVVGLFAQPETQAAAHAVAEHVQDSYVVAFVGNVTTMLGSF